MEGIGHHAREVRAIGPKPNLQDRFSDDFFAAESALSFEAGGHVEKPSVTQGTDGHRVRACAKSSFKFLLRKTQSLLSAETLSDIVSHAANNRRGDARGSQRGSVFPDALLAVFGNHHHVALVLSVLEDSFGKGGIEIPESRGQKVPHVHPQHFFHLVAEAAARGGIDRENATLEIVCTKQVLTVFDQVAKTAFTLA